MSRYFILMGDIDNSRETDNNILQKKFNKIIDKANIVFEENRLSLLGIKIGDDFQVVMDSIESTLNILYYLDIAFLYENISCKFAIGYGEINGNIKKDSIYNLMGSGLTYTNEILSNKQNKSKFRFYIENDLKIEIALNTLGILLEDINNNLTNKRLEFLYLKVVENLNDNEIEKKLNTKERNIYRYKNESSYNLHQKIFEKVKLLFNLNNQELLNKYLEENKLPKNQKRD